MTKKRDRRTVNICIFGFFLPFLLISLFTRVTCGGNTCPGKCSCYLYQEPRRIVCSKRGIKNYPPDISDLVQQLDLSKNDLKTISTELNDLIDLQYLNLASNKLQSLPDNLSQLTQLQKLDLSDNDIATIGDVASINHLTSLKVLFISKNPLTSIDDLTNVALRILDVSRCSISNIVNSSLTGLPELVTLSLQGNPLKSIQRLTSEKLRWLDLSDCCLNYLSPDTFEGAPGLEQLRLSNNPTLVYSSRNETVKHVNLRRLDVSGCNLDRPGLHGFPSLTHAILSKNHIRMLPDRIFAKNRALKELHLNENGLIVNTSSFAGLVKLEVLDLSSNGLKNLHPFAFRDNINLHVLNLSSNEFDTFPNIMSTLVSLDLSANYIRNIPREFFTNLPRIRSLNLSDNRLEGVCDEFESVTLDTLVLKRNRLVELANESFYDLPELRKLDLSGNRLTEGMDASIFSMNKKLGTIVLGDNPWRCDCLQLRRTFLYLTALPRRTESETLICQSPSNVTGFSWEIACFYDWQENRNLGKDRTWGFVLLTLLVLVLIFGSTVSLRHTFSIKRQARRERQRLEREEGVARLELLRRRNLELEAASRREHSEPRINPLELIDPPPYEEAVQMPRMAQSLDALDSISMESRQMIDSSESLRTRKKRQRRTPRNRARSEENLSRRDNVRSQTRRLRSAARRNYSPRVTLEVTGKKNSSTGELARNDRRGNESEERSSDWKQTAARPQTPNSRRKKRRLKSLKNGDSTDDEDSESPRQRIETIIDVNSETRIAIRELPHEPRSGYRTANIQPHIV